MRHDPAGPDANHGPAVSAAVPPEHEVDVLRPAAVPDDAAHPAGHCAVALQAHAALGDRRDAAAGARARPDLADARDADAPELDVRPDL